MLTRTKMRRVDDEVRNLEQMLKVNTKPSSTDRNLLLGVVRAVIQLLYTVHCTLYTVANPVTGSESSSLRKFLRATELTA